MPKISAAMETHVKNQAFFFLYGKRQIKRNLSTALMVHVEGHGPRRVYINRFSGKSYIMLNGKRKFMSDSELSEAYAKAERQGAD